MDYSKNIIHCIDLSIPIAEINHISVGPSALLRWMGSWGALSPKPTVLFGTAS